MKLSSVALSAIAPLKAYNVAGSVGTLAVVGLSKIAERATEDNFNRVCTYAERMPPEFSVLSISYAARKKPELASTKAFTDWAVKHQDILF